MRDPTKNVLRISRSQKQSSKLSTGSRVTVWVRSREAGPPVSFWVLGDWQQLPVPVSWNTQSSQLQPKQLTTLKSPHCEKPKPHREAWWLRCHVERKAKQHPGSQHLSVKASLGVHFPAPNPQSKNDYKNKMLLLGHCLGIVCYPTIDNGKTYYL